MENNCILPAPVPLMGPAALMYDADVVPATATLLELLRRRRSARAFDGRGLSAHQLSSLLWAAWGNNCGDGRQRTAPSSRDRQVIDIYVALAEGAFRFDARRLLLAPVSAQDLRAATGMQEFAASAPVNLVYVASLDGDDDGAGRFEQKLAAAADLGFISQNVYLLCAAEGLATVVRDAFDRPALAAALGLAPAQWIVATQSVGYPAAGDA
ncbi:hypothetical protein RugamoR57_07770 [Duganella caerulea]|uniref:nitroreductase family protein n=1 Tax=Duganella caerulea TaxID=2885762 RepID=UPI0030EAABE1